MNRLIILLTFMTFLASCSSKSDEDRAKELIKDYLKEDMHDPSSYEPVSFGDLRKNNEGDYDVVLDLVGKVEDIYKIDHKYRGKNRLGNKVLNERTFILDKDLKSVTRVLEN